MVAIQLFLAVAVISVAVYRRSLTVWIVASMVLGAVVGHLWPTVAIHFQVLGTIFLRLIKVIIAPLLFGTLVSGIAGHTDLKRVYRVGLKALVYFEIVSTLALLFGFAAANISHPGIGVHLPSIAGTASPEFVTHSWSETFINMFPENIAKSIADGQILQIVVFCIVFGEALAMVAKPYREPMVNFVSSLSETMFKFTNLIMYLAPFGVFGATAYTVGHLGIGIFLPLLKLLVTMYLVLIVFSLTVFVPIARIARVPILRFLKALMEPLAIAFGTASSEAALPQSIEKLEEMGVSRETVALVLPLGFSFNLAGSGIYQPMALIFVAEISGIHLTFSQQVIMLMTLLISSKGIGGVARGALVVILAVAASFHLPMESVLVLFGIDQLMDMGRTVINVLGNCLATVAVSRWEGEEGLLIAEHETK